jgi:hypothetical protein
MATTTSITSTYAGQFAGKYIAAALLSATTLDKEYITLRPNIKYKEVMKKFASDGIVKDATCDFSPSSSITLTERILTPEEFQVNLQLCKKDFRSDWEAIEMGMSVYDNLPANFTDFLLGNVSAQVAEQIEKNIWSGSNAATGQFDGFLQLFGTAGSGVLSGSFGASGSITGSSTVQAGLQLVLDKVPDTVYGKEDLIIYISNATAKAYQASLAANGGYNNQGAVGLKPMDYQGIPLAVVPGLPAGNVVAAQKSNLFFGTGLLADSNEVKVIDMADIDGSQNVRIVMRYTAGVQFGIGSEIVWFNA